LPIATKFGIDNSWHASSICGLSTHKRVKGETSKMQTKSTGYSKVNINFQVTGEHAKLIHDAAASHTESAAGYCRRVMLEWASADLGLGLPDMSEYNGDIISNAAKKLGMTAQEFTNMVAKEQAARVLLEGRDNATVIGKLSSELRATLHGGKAPAESGERSERASGFRRRQG
jgi:uncharacterized protein (DUF1778 family)